VISDNSIENSNLTAIFLSNTHNSIIKDNVATNGYRGLYLGGNLLNNVVKDNVFANSAEGIQEGGTSTVYIDNILLNNVEDWSQNNPGQLGFLDHEQRITSLENAGDPSLDVTSFTETIDVPYQTPLTEIEISCPAGNILWKDVSDVGVTAASNVDKMGSPYLGTDKTTSFILKYSHNNQNTNDGWITAKYNCLEVVP
jgi:parallel beta-helix repeat protein